MADRGIESTVVWYKNICSSGPPSDWIHSRSHRYRVQTSHKPVDTIILEKPDIDVEMIKLPYQGCSTKCSTLRDTDNELKLRLNSVHLRALRKMR